MSEAPTADIEIRVNNCSNCAHWSGVPGGQSSVCNRILSGQASESDRAFVETTGDVGALWTRPEFGCFLYEPKS